MPFDLHHAPLITDLPTVTPVGLPAALRTFCLQTRTYRDAFLQRHYGDGFDGYSFPGQEDSLNQGPEDHLHSFVFSDRFAPERYPPPLQTFIQQHWPGLTHMVHRLERDILTQLGQARVADQYARYFQHMMSANYFPGRTSRCDDSAVVTAPAEASPRLSAHPDVSLLTVFFNGLGEGFQYRDARGVWVDAPVTDTIVVFAGELLEWMTDGAIPALHHRVRQGADTAERFSFALFSIPSADAELVSNAGERITTQEWFRLHLSQWDN